MYGCESWTVKKAEHKRIDAFELWYWRRLLQVHWMAKRSNHSMLRETNPEYFTGRTDAEAPIFRSSDMKRWLIGKVRDAGKDRGQREEGIRGWMPSLMQWIWTWANSMDMDLGGQGGLVCCGSWGGKESDTTEQLNKQNHLEGSGDLYLSALRLYDWKW